MTSHTCQVTDCTVRLEPHQVFCLHHGIEEFTVPTLVRCPNGITTRHSNRAQAMIYADQGHCCVAVHLHQIRPLPTPTPTPTRSIR